MITNTIGNETIKIERLFLEEKKISPHLICFICKKVFNNPVLIDCGHTFCYSCLTQKLKENGGYCPFCHLKNYSTKISRDLMAYNLVMELEVSCNNVGKCPWIGHLSELVAHQNSCDKAMQIIENNNKEYVKNISKRFSYNKDINKENENNDSTIFNRTEVKKNKTKEEKKDDEIMINNLEKLKQKIIDTNKKLKVIENKGRVEEFKKLFS